MVNYRLNIPFLKLSEAERFEMLKDYIKELESKLYDENMKGDAIHVKIEKLLNRFGFKIH